jgi:hypothetical protein
MDKVTLGLICGAVFGLVSAGIMIPMKLGDKRQKTESLVASFIERFMLGFLIPVVCIGLNPIATGALLGLGLSVPTALITRAYAPIIGIGVAGGIIIGVITNVVLY